MIPKSCRLFGQDHAPKSTRCDHGAILLDRIVLGNGVPVQRCTIHKHRNLLAHAPERLHERRLPPTTTRRCFEEPSRVARPLSANGKEEFKRRIKTQTVLRLAGTAAMLFWALLISGQDHNA
jgi:hypothetical protein